LSVVDSVRFQASVPWADMPGVYAAGNVFALPCRTRLGGLEPEALGIVFLEAAAAGLPVVVGASGGAPETVVDRLTGRVVDPRSPGEIAHMVSALLTSPSSAEAMGLRGRQWVAENHAGRCGQVLPGLLDAPVR
jgi:phosphatidylinositol alpha-1,6-mannosyltransferase